MTFLRQRVPARPDHRARVGPRTIKHVSTNLTRAPPGTKCSVMVTVETEMTEAM